MSTEEPERDSPLADEWRRHSIEEPGAHLDARVLSAAHQELDRVRRAPRDLSRIRRWRVPLATAATLATVALGILVTRPDRELISTRTVRAQAQDLALNDMPAAAPTAPTASTAPAVIAAPEPRAYSSTPLERKVKDERNSYRAAKREETADKSAAAGAAAAAGADAQEMTSASVARVSNHAAKPTDVDAVIAHIRTLYYAGQMAQAADELNALRAWFPQADLRLPAELRAWAATVKR